MSKRVYLTLPQKIRDQLFLTDKVRQEMGLYVFGGPLPEKRKRK